jgi:ATP-dependent Clp protease ATP-binding subunit ClpA
VFERFTDHSRRVVVLAQEDARRLSHNYIGTEHLLLGLLHEREGIAARSLESLGLSHESVYQQVETIIGVGKRPPSGHIPFTPRAKKILELSLKEYLQLGGGGGGIDTQHILLGLIAEGGGVAIQALVDLGVDPAAVRARVLDLSEAGESGEWEPGGTSRTAGTAGAAGAGGADGTQSGRAESGGESSISQSSSSELSSAERNPDGAGQEATEVRREEITAATTPLGRLRGLLAGVRGPGEPEPDPPARRPAARTLRYQSSDQPSGWSLTERARQGLTDPVVEREAPATLLMEGLCRRRRNNVLLIGESGSGKSALVDGLVGAIGEDRVPALLAKAGVFQIEHSALWASSTRLMSGSQSGSAVLVIEDLDLLLGVDAGGIGYAAASVATICHSNRPLIATITPAGYRAMAEAQPLLAAQFQQIAVPATGAAETVLILTALRESCQRHYGVTITDDAIAAAPALAAVHLPARVLPGSAVDLIDAAGARLYVAGARLAGDEATVEQQADAPVVDEELLVEIALEMAAAARDLAQDPLADSPSGPSEPPSDPPSDPSGPQSAAA